MTAAALVVAIGVIVLNQKPAPSAGHLVNPPTSWANAAMNGEAVGSADAPVVMALYSDFQCPACGSFVREQLASLKSEFIDTGILRIEAYDIAFLGSGDPDESLELAVGARCAAEQNRYWPFHDIVYWNQMRENRGDYSAAFIASVAVEAGVDVSTWDACVTGDEARVAIRAATADAFRAGINSTPTIALNGGPPIAGVPDPVALAAQIRALAAGTAPSASAAP